MAATAEMALCLLNGWKCNANVLRNPKQKGENEMIYNLTHEFTMLEQTEGLMQNMTLHTPIELVTCQENPLKDSGIALMPLEKMKFATCENERIYARCTKLDGTIATLSVVNIQSAVKCNAHKETSRKKLVFVPRMKKFDVAGTYDWAVPETGWYKVTVIGSGGGGGNCSISTTVSAENLIYVAVSSGSGGGGARVNREATLRRGGKGGDGAVLIEWTEVQGG